MNYSVPEDWFPSENIKDELIFNFQELNIADTYVEYEINVRFQLFNNADRTIIVQILIIKNLTY